MTGACVAVSIVLETRKVRLGISREIRKYFCGPVSLSSSRVAVLKQVARTAPPSPETVFPEGVTTVDSQCLAQA